MNERAAPTIAVIGEALIDLTEGDDDEPRLAYPGGSPYNVAVGLARLGCRTAFVGRMSSDPLGAVLRNHALRSHVDLSLAVHAHEPSTVALVELDASGGASYTFGVDATADFRWTEAELAQVPRTTAAVHFGSLASWLGPGDTAIAHRVAALRGAGAAVSYDPNVRPQLQADRAAARADVEASIRLAHLVKASEEDLAWIRPGENPADVARSWLALGAAAVVLTQGKDGATAFTATATVNRPRVAVEVVDTVGAGDAFTSGLLAALDKRGMLRPDAIADAPYHQLLDEAALVAAITCSRAGANPPRAAEVAAFASAS